VRVVVEEGVYRLLEWLDAGDLATVVTEATDLAPAPGEVAGKAPGPGVTIWPGTPVLVEESRRGHRRVKVADECATASGWLPARRLGRLYVPSDRAVDQGGGVMVASASVVEDRPGGRALARFSDSCWAVEAGAPDEGRVPVVYRGSGFEVRGWVNGASGGGGSRPGGGVGYGMLDSQHGDFEVPAGTCLYSRQGGELIGIAVDDHNELAERHGRWWLLGLATDWGELPVWVVEEVPGEQGNGAAPAPPPGDDAAGSRLGGLLRRRTPIPHGPLRRCR
jgi:hypothetical protein